jgi:hypothetical protein
MGYATVMRVPQVTDYGVAKNLHNATKPTRGRSPEIRPLGDRRDVDNYSVRMNGDDVEFVLYRTPVITYRTNGEIVLRTDGWASVSSHQFIARVLSIPARGKSGSSVFKVGKQDYTMTGDSKLVLCREGTGAWKVLEHETLYGYKASRKALTNVRSRYSEFRKYLGGFINLRQEEHVLNQGRAYERRFNRINFGVQEAVNLFGVMDSTYNDAKALNREKIGCIFGKPTKLYYFNPTETQKQDHRDAIRKYEENMKAFTDTIVNGQPEDVRHENFYRGAMALLVEWYRESRSTHNAEWVLHDYDMEGWVHVDEWMPMIDEAILKYHAEEVLERVALELGKTPNPKYASWISEIV